MTNRPQIMLSAVTALCAASLLQVQSQAETVAEVRELIGLNSLTERLGPGQVPTGAGIGILQCEASEGGANWGPDTSLVDFAGKSFTYPAGSPGVSSHATNVARWAYGSNWSIAQDISDIYVYEVGSFLLSGFLRTGRGGEAPRCTSSLPDSSIRIEPQLDRAVRKLERQSGVESFRLRGSPGQRHRDGGTCQRCGFGCPSHGLRLQFTHGGNHQWDACDRGHARRFRRAGAHEARHHRPRRLHQLLDGGRFGGGRGDLRDHRDRPGACGGFSRRQGFPS